MLNIDRIKKVFENKKSLTSKEIKDLDLDDEEIVSELYERHGLVIQMRGGKFHILQNFQN